MPQDEYFTWQRQYGKDGALKRKQGDRPTSGWESFPDDYPNADVDYPAPKYGFCTDHGVKCQ